MPRYSPVDDSITRSLGTLPQTPPRAPSTTSQPPAASSSPTSDTPSATPGATSPPTDPTTNVGDFADDESLRDQFYVDCNAAADVFAYDRGAEDGDEEDEELEDLTLFSFDMDDPGTHSPCVLMTGDSSNNGTR